MPAYWLARSVINDPVAYKRYTDQVPGIIQQFGGKVLGRGGRVQVMEGPQKWHRFVVLEFPTFKDGVNCFESEIYRDAAAHRRASGVSEAEIIMLDGGEFTK